MLILASASPRRSDLLSKLGFDFIVMPSAFDEEIKENLAPEEYAMRCAEGKAWDVYNKYCADSGLADILNKKQALSAEDGLNINSEKYKSDTTDTQNKKPSVTVLGADTVVVAGGKVLGKPSSKESSREMLKTVCGNPHMVITGVCLIKNGKATMDFESTVLFIDSLSDNEIDAYIDSGSPFDKAGGYGLQDKIISIKLRYINGSRDNVIGLPTRLVAEMLEKL